MTPSSLAEATATIPRVARNRSRAETNRLEADDRPAHDWYRFVLSFPPHLVRDYLQQFEIKAKQQVLDPFCGTGTTLVECKKHGIRSVGIEAHPMSHFASVTKLNWELDADRLEKAAMVVAENAIDLLERQGIIDDPQPNLLREEPPRPPLRKLPAEAAKLLLTDSISPLPLHKTLVESDRRSLPGRWKLGVSALSMNTNEN
jgi:hypothetical protein